MTDKEAIRSWVNAWKTAAPELNAIRQREIEQADNREVIALLEPMFNQATRALPMRETSGLVEMQRLFAKLRASKIRP